MLRRYRELVLLLAGALFISVSLWAALAPRRLEIPSPDIVESADRHYQPGGVNCQPGTIIPGGLPQPELDRCAEEAERYRLQFNDLVQQTRAANAAEAQAFMAYNMSWMVLIGTAGGFFTFFAAAAAALYARAAAEAAKASVAHAAEVSEAELRPWLQLEIVPAQFRLTDKKAVVHYAVHLKNLGKLPATRVLTDGRIFNLGSDIEEIPGHFDSVFEPSETVTPRTILPQDKIELQGSVWREREQLELTDSGEEKEVHPVLAVRVVYEWGDGSQGRTCQSYAVYSQRRPGEEHLKPISINPVGVTRRRFEVKRTQFDSIC